MFTRFSNFLRIAFLLIVASALVANCVAAHSQASAQCRVTVKVTGLRNATGNVRAILRSGPETVVQHKEVEIDAKTMTAEAVFTDLPPGTYGVAVIHDENKNGVLDFNEMGMPVEGYGHSNNPSKRQAPPSFDETKFTLNPGGAVIEINLIYWP